MDVTIRKFIVADIPLKVAWVNDRRNNAYLHYDLPLMTEKTKTWYDRIEDREDRYDAVIEVDGLPCGLIGVLNIDKKNKKAEYYVMMGDVELKGKGISKKASWLILDYAFNTLSLNKVYLFTETENVVAQRLFEKIGFIEEGLVREDLFSKERYVDRIMYGMLKREYNIISGEGYWIKTSNTSTHFFKAA